MMRQVGQTHFAVLYRIVMVHRPRRWTFVHWGGPFTSFSRATDSNSWIIRHPRTKVRKPGRRMTKKMMASKLALSIDALSFPSDRRPGRAGAGRPAPGRVPGLRYASERRFRDGRGNPPTVRVSARSDWDARPLL